MSTDNRTPFCPTCDRKCTAWSTPNIDGVPYAPGQPSTCQSCKQPVIWPDAKRAVLVAYMRMMIDEGDWHAVSDAANDLREMEAEERGKGNR